tara:strand:- start:1571 stop:2284 length:714 start_codon:yes stop_codon:yes gene_type:complete
VLQPIGPDIWIAEGPVLEWGYGIPVKWPFPTRMTVVRLASGEIWIHSPVSADEKLMDAVAALGPVGHIVSPNAIHHVSIGPWAKHFPGARVWASPGVRERSDVTFTDDLGNTPPPDWADEFDQRIARGSPEHKEVVFFHTPSRTLILTDLIENFEPERLRGPLNHFMYRLIGVMAPHGKAPRDMRWSFIGHHNDLRPTIRWMLDSKPERVIIAHGKWIDGEVNARLREAFSWVKGIG